MQVQMGALAAIPQLESRTDEQLQGESRHRVAAKAILGARAAERYDAKTARAYFNEALAGAHPQERPAGRQGGEGAALVQRGARRRSPAGAARAAADDEGLAGTGRAPPGRAAGRHGEARPGG